MEPDDSSELTIITVRPADAPSELGMFPSPSRFVAALGKVSVQALGDNLCTFVSQLQKILDRLPEASSGFGVDSLTFHLNVDSSGKIALIGELSAGVTSGVAITLKRQKGTSND